MKASKPRAILMRPPCIPIGCIQHNPQQRRGGKPKPAAPCLTANPVIGDGHVRHRDAHAHKTPDARIQQRIRALSAGSRDDVRGHGSFGHNDDNHDGSDDARSAGRPARKARAQSLLALVRNARHKPRPPVAAPPPPTRADDDGPAKC